MRGREEVNHADIRCSTFAGACYLRPGDRRQTSKGTQGYAGNTFRIMELVILPIVVEAVVRAEVLCGRKDDQKSHDLQQPSLYSCSSAATLPRTFHLDLKAARGHCGYCRNGL